MMKKLKPTVIVITVCAVAFLGGIGAGYLRREKTIKKNEVKYELVNVLKEEETVFEKTVKDKYYTVMSKGEYVSLFEVTPNNTKRELQRMNIADIYLPEEERERLSNGIDFYEKEEALMVMESFIS